MNDADPIEIVTRGDLELLRKASDELRRLARDSHRQRAAEADARGPRQTYGTCSCGGGCATDGDAACESADNLRRIVSRWVDAARSGRRG